LRPPLALSEVGATQSGSDYFLQSAYAHIMGRTAYEAIAGSMTTSTDHPFAPILTAGRKVVFSRTLRTAEWANTMIATGDTAEEIDKLRLGGGGYIVVWGGVSFWRSLILGHFRTRPGRRHADGRGTRSRGRSE
jgi:dihydrofolate reductase